MKKSILSYEKEHIKHDWIVVNAKYGLLRCK